MEILPEATRRDDLLRAEEESYAYFAERTALPGVALFTSERADASEFDLALIHQVESDRADAILEAIVRHFEVRGRAPRVRLTPWSAPADWPDRLQRAGFAETDERHLFMILPGTARIADDPAIVIRRAVTLEDADCYSAIQVIGFDLPIAHHAWDRELARRHLAGGRRRFFLATLAGRTVGAVSSQDSPGRITGIYGITTLPDARRRGVATSLLSRMVEDGGAAGSRVIYLTVVPGSAGQSLYARLGFTPLFVTRTFARETAPMIV